MCSEVPPGGSRGMPEELGERAAPIADARVSPRVVRVAESVPSPRHAPAEKGSHHCVAEQVSAHCTHRIHDPSTPSSRIVRVVSTTSKGLHCGGGRRRVTCARCSSLVHLHSVLFTRIWFLCARILGGGVRERLSVWPYCCTSSATH